MSIRDSINKRSDRVIRRLTDSKYNSLGREVPVARVRIERDMYNNQRYEPVLVDSPKVILHFPTDIPIDRYRMDTEDVDVDETRVFMFDVLPVDLYTRWEDKIEKGDFIVYKIFDENDEEIPILLRVSETMGSFRYSMVWKYQHCAPYNGELTEEVKTALNDV